MFSSQIFRQWVTAVVAGGLLLAIVGIVHAEGRVFNSDKQRFVVTELVDGLEHPWGMAFIPGGDILVTERSGQLRMVRNGELLEQEIAGLPDIHASGQGGLLGITLHPEFEKNRLIYLAYTGKDGGKSGTEVMRGRLQGMSLVDVETIFKALPKSRGGRHFGARVLFAPDNSLYISLGDRGYKPSLCEDHPSQTPANHIGTLIRIDENGAVPQDNPFVGQTGIRPEVFTYGNRNMQGMALHPKTAQVWTHEHGPQGGDELNIMRAGVNYGWPVITYGVNYGIGTKICEGSHKPGMAQPVYKWVPSIAPSGMAFYNADRLAGWKGNLFVGSLKFGLLVRLELDGNEVIAEERLLDDEYGRIRDVVEGPDGYLYLLTDSAIGSILKLGPSLP